MQPPAETLPLPLMGEETQGLLIQPPSVTPSMGPAVNVEGIVLIVQLMGLNAFRPVVSPSENKTVVPQLNTSETVTVGNPEQGEGTGNARQNISEQISCCCVVA